AIGLGLFFQSGISAWDAAASALALYAAFVGAHVLVRRSQALPERTHEVDRLESEVRRLAGGAGQGPRVAPARNRDPQLSSSRPGPHVAPSGAKVPHSHPMPQPDVPVPQSWGGQAPSKPSSRKAGSVEEPARAGAEPAPQAAAQAHKADMPSDAGAKAMVPGD